MLEGMLTPALAPFSIALGVMLLIAITEAMGTVFGISPSGLVDQMVPDMDVDVDVDLDADVDADASAEPSGFLSGLLGWLCIGKVPVLVLLVAFLTAFGISGMVLQSIAKSALGFHLPAVLAVCFTLFVALPPTRWFALGLSKIMPKEESEAVSTTSFIGKVATITRGIARKGVPAEAKLRDVHGQMHYVLVEPDVADEEFPLGSEVLLTNQSSAIRFKAIRNNNALMASS